jgi:sugar phosphate isomerase/epimerase
MNSEIELVASYWTIAGQTEPLDLEVSPLPFRSRVEAAAKAGFKGVGLVHADLIATSSRLGLKEMKLILEDNGMKHLELEILGNWFADGESKAKSDKIKRDLLQAAGQLAPRHIKVGPCHNNRDWPIRQMIDSFAALCNEAADYGTKIALEIMPWTNVRTVETGLQIVQGAAAANGGLLLDVWHFARGSIQFSKISEIPEQWIGYVELDDAAAAPEGTLIEDTIHRRKLCGKGDLDLRAFIRAVQCGGYQGPFGVEIISVEQRSRELHAAATLAFETAMAQFESAP